MRNITVPVVLAFSFLLGGCTLPWVTQGPITGTEEQKMQKIADIMASGGSVDCKVTNLEDNSVTTMIISGEKMKISGTSFGEGKTGTMINDSVYTYSWEEGQKSGFKMKNPEPVEGDKTEVSEEAPDTKETAKEFEDETKYKTECNARSVADSEFVPPSDVKFVDPSQMQNLSPQELMKLYPNQD